MSAKQHCTSFVLGILPVFFFTWPVTGQTPPLDAREENRQWQDNMAHCFVLELAMPQDFAAAQWEDFVKDLTGERVREKNDVYTTSEVSLDESENRGDLLMKLEPATDSVRLIVRYKLGYDIDASTDKYPNEAAGVKEFIRAFAVQAYLEMYESELTKTGKQIKELESTLKDREKAVKKNERDIKKLNRDAKKTPEQKNEFLGKAKDLQVSNEEIHVKIKEIRARLDRTHTKMASQKTAFDKFKIAAGIE